jgi:hypothetical protein
MDPVTLSVVSGVVGGASGKFIELAGGLGIGWIRSYFAGHRQKAIETGQQNASAFLNELAVRVEALEKAQAVPASIIGTALEHPSFSVLLQRAMVASAETDSSEKHKLLARLVADRLAVGSESTFALASKMACDAISQLTSRQLRVLGFQVALRYIRPTKYPAFSSNDQYFDFMYQFLRPRLAPYQTLELTALDLVHLESLSCVHRRERPAFQLQDVLSHGERAFDLWKFSATDTGKNVGRLWNMGMNGFYLTSVGQLVGISVSDLLVGETTAFVGWGE